MTDDAMSKVMQKIAIALESGGRWHRVGVSAVMTLVGVNYPAFGISLQVVFLFKSPLGHAAVPTTWL